MRRLRVLVGTLAGVPVTLFGLVLATILVGRIVPIDPILVAVLGATLVIGPTCVGLNLLADLAYRAVTPRVR